ncbi:MAG: phosphatidate cytidylyltransferase [Crocinitomicaceae bacterium]|nr:phosphatidate cytidylyltransferase [Crocinitomicaceae bacterium]
MNQEEWIHTAIYAGLFLILFTIGELLYHKLKLPAEITRKFVHMGTGVICLTFPFFLGSHWSVLVLTISFFAILLVSIKFNLLKSINSVDRKTGGSFIFPVVIYLTFWAYSIFGLGDMDATGLDWKNTAIGREMFYGATVYYFLPILILSISDPMAALIGKKWPVGKYKIFGCTKTFMGSAAFFLSALALSIIFMMPLATSPEYGMLIALCIAFSTTLVEAICHRGIDNLLIPLTAVFVMVMFNENLQL